MTKEQFDRIVLTMLYAFVLGLAAALVYRMWQ